MVMTPDEYEEKFDYLHRTVFNRLVVDKHNFMSLARHDRIQQVKKWHREKLIGLSSAPLAPCDKHTHVVAWIGGQPYQEPFDVFPSEVMVARILLAIQAHAI